MIFSRLDPEDKLVIGCRKATVPAEAPAFPNPVSGTSPICTDNGNLPTVGLFVYYYYFFLFVIFSIHFHLLNFYLCQRLRSMKAPVTGIQCSH